MATMKSAQMNKGFPKEYETVIGLEVHVELATNTKIFCGCSTAFGGKPNSHTCPVCTGMPGTLPVLNKKVLEHAVAVGLATNCRKASMHSCERTLQQPCLVCGEASSQKNVKVLSKEVPSAEYKAIFPRCPHCYGDG